MATREVRITGGRDVIEDALRDLQHGNVSSEADVCSPDCARDFATSALEQMGATDAPAS